MASNTLPPAQRKKILRVLFISLLLDLVGLILDVTLLRLTDTLVLDIVHLHSSPVPLATYLLSIP